MKTRSLKSNLLLVAFLIMGVTLKAQQPEKLSSSEIYKDLKRLNFLGTVLYVAAHPDDENTRMISYYSNEVMARTAYLSITRGDGGQNLIGPELRELLGVIRTNELVQARNTDGGEQFFTRANDFGYSKHPDETLRIWNKTEVMKDVVSIIRKYQPDVIINRFDHNSAGKTHGHHTTSAMLSLEAFDKVGDPTYQVDGQAPWKVRRIFFNTHWWFYGSQEKFAEVDKSKMISIDVGAYYDLLGLSNSEIASLSRSQHQSQGFGSTGTRGSNLEYVELLKGDMPETNDIFDGINTTWTRVKGGKEIGRILAEVETDFDFQAPYKSIPKLLKAYRMIQKLEDDHWRVYKSAEIVAIIEACSGLYLEAVAKESTASRLDSISLSIEAINRGKIDYTLKGITVLPSGKQKGINETLGFNEAFDTSINDQISKNLEYTSPYWLEEEGTLGMYTVKDRNLIGKPLNPRSVLVKFDLESEGIQLSVVKPVVYKYNDPVKGEVYQPFEIVPDASVRVASEVVIFNENHAKEIPVTVTAHKDDLKGQLSLNLPNGWRAEPRNIDMSFKNKGEEQVVKFTVFPTAQQSEGKLSPVFKTNGREYRKAMVSIDYDHIPKQLVQMDASAKVVRLNLVKKGEKIAYVQGAGDEIPKFMRQVGYQVEEIDPNQISPELLRNYDAVIMGIRAYNTLEVLKVKQQYLLDYVEKGGNMIVQYNTSHRLKVKDDLAPYPLLLSRDRITDENAQVSFVDKDHEILNYPNKIVNRDFEGWVQERGLYFPNSWSEDFQPILSFEENGEGPKKGSLLVAKYGKGYYIYTGLSFFRELPAGVPGAYKLFTNMISIGKNELEKELKE